MKTFYYCLLDICKKYNKTLDDRLVNAISTFLTDCKGAISRETNEIENIPDKVPTGLVAPKEGLK